MSSKEIMELISLCTSLLIPIIGFVTALVKIIKEKNWNILKSNLCEFIIKAEEMVDSTGQEKKNAVLTWAEEFCKEQGIKFDAKQVSSAIEKLIELSKKVNVGQKSAAEPKNEEAS